MGARNAIQAHTEWWDLPPDAKLVLNIMALFARNDDDPPRYWGGPTPLALALGRRPEHDNTLSEADHKAVRRALAKLLQAGAIRNVAPHGRPATYVLLRREFTPRPDPPPPVDNSP